MVQWRFIGGVDVVTMREKAHRHVEFFPVKQVMQVRVIGHVS